jgi:hypothetical protein
LDSGFFDQKIFKLCEDLKIGYICGGNLYKDIKPIASAVEPQFWSELKSGKKENWEYIEFGTKRQNWSKFRRAVYSRLTNDGSQLILPGCRPDTVIITNLGQGQEIDKLLKSADREDYLHTDKIISCYLRVEQMNWQTVLLKVLDMSSSHLKGLNPMLPGIILC